jgi:hypothetical protein
MCNAAKALSPQFAKVIGIVVANSTAGADRIAAF